MWIFLKYNRETLTGNPWNKLLAHKLHSNFGVKGKKYLWTRDIILRVQIKRNGDIVHLQIKSTIFIFQK